VSTSSRDPRLGRRTALGLLAYAPLAAVGCSSPYVRVDRGWENARRTDYVLPRWRWAPKSARDVIDAVARAEKEGHRLRMVGSGHSFSDVAVSDDWLLDPTGLTSVLPLDRSSLRADAHPETLVRIGGGMTIHNLNACPGSLSVRCGLPASFAMISMR
jgi:FAD/FMN-containing dehydrogenase